jgi:RHS repeat-associated protein
VPTPQSKRCAAPATAPLVRAQLAPASPIRRFTDFPRACEHGLEGSGRAPARPEGSRIYRADGSRARKVIERIGTLVEERIYLGGYEVYRKRDHTGLLLQRETLHVMDDKRRVAMVETKTVDTAAGPFTVTPRYRFQLDDHIWSARFECDETGLVISYEEFHPYGTSAYRSARSGVEVSERRFRYTGKERDDETGFQIHGLRYYVPWLGRWTTSDPIGLQGGLNGYGYCRGDPVGKVDPGGTQDQPPAKQDPTFTDYVKAAVSFGFTYRTGQTPQQFGSGMVDKAERTFIEPVMTVYGPEGMLDKAAQKGVDLAMGRGGGDYVTPEEHARMGWAAGDVVLSLSPFGRTGAAAAPGSPFLPLRPGGGTLSLAPVGGGGAALEAGVARPLVGVGTSASPGWFVGGSITFSLGSGGKKPTPEPKDDLEKRGARYTKDLNIDYSRSKDLYPTRNGKKGAVEIEYTGDYDADFRAANNEAGFGDIPGSPDDDYVWHHFEYNKTTNRGTMQLVRVEAHRVRHFGGVAQYEAARGVKYTHPARK